MNLHDLFTPPYSSLADLRDVPLAEMPAASAGLLEQTLGRVLPPAAVKSTPAAAFQSSI